MCLWVRLLDDPAPDPVDLVRTAENYPAATKGEARYVLGAALLRAGRREDAIHSFEESLAVEGEWPESGLNAFGLALAHQSLGHADEAKRWRDRAESWLGALDKRYETEASKMLSGQPQAPVTFEFWVYAQVLRRELTKPMLPPRGQ